MTLIKENRSTWKLKLKTCPNAPVSTTKAIRNGLGLNTELRGETPATQHGLSHNCRPLYSAHNLSHNEREELSDEEVLLAQRLCLFGCNRQDAIQITYPLRPPSLLLSRSVHYKSISMFYFSWSPTQYSSHFLHYPHKELYRSNTSCAQFHTHISQPYKAQVLF